MNKNADMPDVTAIIPLIAQVKPFAEKLYAEAFVKPLDLVEFAKKTQQIHLARLDDKNNPLIVKDAKGRESLILMWGHPKNYFDTNFLVGMICPLSKDNDGMNVYRPATLVRGPLANIMVVGGMSCCGSALQAHWSEVQTDGSLRDDSRVPVMALKKKEFANWLRGRVDVADTPDKVSALHAMAMDMMAHRLPNDARFKKTGQDYISRFTPPDLSL